MKAPRRLLFVTVYEEHSLLFAGLRRVPEVSQKGLQGSGGVPEGPRRITEGSLQGLKDFK